MTPSVLIVMGVSGSGKTTVARALAEALGWSFLDGDDLHPPANVAKMARGVPLDDADRAPWLEATAARIDAWRSERRRGVVACSALKRRYREILIGARPDVALIYLKGARDLLAARLAARKGHFMPAGLLDSQFATLEEPAAEERAIVVDVGGSPQETVAAALAELKARGWG